MYSELSIGADCGCIETPSFRNSLACAHPLALNVCVYIYIYMCAAWPGYVIFLTRHKVAKLVRIWGSGEVGDR